MKYLLWILVGVLVTLFMALTFTPPAHAEATRFMCATEVSANAIASAITKGGDAPNIAAAPFLSDGTCFYLPTDVHIDITYHGMVFVGAIQVEVVGFTDETGKMLYGLMPVETPPAEPLVPKRDG